MHGYFHLYVMFLEYTCLNIHLFAWDNRVSYVRDLLCAHPSVLCVFRPVKAFILSSVFIWKLVLPLRITLITEEGSWEGRVLVGSSRFVRSTVQETERVEKNNKDCACMLPWPRRIRSPLWSYTFNQTVSASRSPRDLKQLPDNTSPLPWNTHQIHISCQGYKGKGFDKSAPGCKGAWGEFIRKIRANLNSVSVQTEKKKETN